jgi:hypothetical protein
MTDGHPDGEKFLTKDPKKSHYFQIFKDSYEAKKPSKMRYSEEPLIPKVMHQIWIGPEMPVLYKSYLEECQKLHPDWEFKVWGDKEVAELNLEYADVYDKLRSYAAKADILRYEILYRFGGVYRDVDLKCYKPIDDLNHLYDAYFYLDGPFVYKQGLISNNLIASKPGNYIFKNTLDEIRSNIDKQLHEWDEDIKDNSLHNFAVKKTMMPLTDILVKDITLLEKTVALPPTYFSPLRPNFRLKRYTTIEFPNIVLKTHFSFLKPESLGMHNYNESKTEIIHSKFKNDNGLQDPCVRSAFDSLSSQYKKVYNIFDNIMVSNQPEKVGWNKVSKMPQVINFVLFGSDERKILNKNIPMWQMLNGNFEIKTWDIERLLKVFPEIDLARINFLSEDLRFYIGLKIIDKFGGTYANFKAIPYTPMFELNNKYNFYAGLMSINSDDPKIILSKKLIGASIHNPIISKTLEQIDAQNSDSLKSISEILTKTAYENMYLNGKNIVLSASHFEPLNDPSSVKCTIVDKVWRFIKRKPKAFSQLTDYAIVE